MSKQNSRQSNIELLRILSMFLIVLSHFASHGSWESASIEIQTVLKCFTLGGPLGVDLFVLISGYFLIQSKFKARSLFRVLAPAVFWSLFFFLLFYLVDSDDFSTKLLFDIPWFVLAYCLMYLFVPWMNLLAKSMSQQGYIKLLVLGFLLLSVFSSIGGKVYVYSNVAWFCYLYLFAGYLRLYSVRISLVKSVALLLFCAFVSVVGSILPSVVSQSPVVLSDSGFFNSRNSIFLFGLAIAVFVLFEKIDMGSNPIVNNVSSLTFGVYLVSDNAYVRGWLWPHFSLFADAGIVEFIAFAMLAVLAVYLCATVFEFARSFFSSKLFHANNCKWAASVYKKIDEYFSF